jgi:hypothetical protein
MNKKLERNAVQQTIVPGHKYVFLLSFDNFNHLIPFPPVLFQLPFP